MLSVLFALCAAASNALGSVFQRRAARDVPESDALSLRLVLDLVKRPAWLAGIGGLIGGFLFQAAALSQGSLVVVQPLLVAELPLTLLLAVPVLGGTLGRRGWLATAALSGGLAVLLVSAAPRPGHHQPGWLTWTLAAVAAAALLGGLVAAARSARGPLRTALLGTAAGAGFGVTAAVMKVTTTTATQGIGALFTSWPVYAMVVFGIASFYLLQNAFQSGRLVFAQPAVTIIDPVIATIAGIVLFHDRVRGGGWIAGQLLGVALIVAGVVTVAHAPVFTRSQERAAAPAS